MVWCQNRIIKNKKLSILWKIQRLSSEQYFVKGTFHISLWQVDESINNSFYGNEYLVFSLWGINAGIAFAKHFVCQYFGFYYICCIKNIVCLHFENDWKKRKKIIDKMLIFAIIF